MKKRFLIFTLLLALMLTLCACGKQKDPYSAAQALIGEDVSALTAAIGEPKSSSYASSCLGDGDDGEWQYDGFTVYTFRAADGTETVYDVMAQQ